MGANRALRELLVNDAILQLTEKHGKMSCFLPEDKANYGFDLLGLPCDALIIKCDRFPTTKNVFFKSDNKECKRADFVLVSESEKVIMFFELKKSQKSAKANDIVAQLKGAKCVMDYCESISSSFLGEHCIFKDYIFKYYKGFVNTPQKYPFAKQKTSNNTPETARTLSGSSAWFGKLMKG